MKGSRLGLLAFLILAAVVVTAVASLRSQEGKNPTPGRQMEESAHLRKLPVVDYESPEPADLEQRAKRRAKSKTYNSKAVWRRDRTLNVDLAAIRNEWDLGLESNLPASQSSAVVVGRVVEAAAHLSEDRSTVYSEFMVRVEEVLKNDGAEPVTSGVEVITERLGGRVRVPSGRVGSFYVSGQGVPEAGKRYLFFLGYNWREAANMEVGDTSERSRHILTGYELRGGKVFPLDVSGAKNFTEHGGKDEAAFLDEVRRLVGGPSTATPR